MEMYIEDALINTTFVNAVILFLTQYSLKIKFKFWKTLLLSVFGSIYSLVLNCFNFYPIALFLLKICCGLIICTFMVPQFNIKNFITYFLIFISFTFLLGGFSYAVLFFIGGKDYSLEDISKNSSYVFSIIYLLLAIYIWFLITLIKNFYKKQKFQNFIYNIKIFCNNKNYFLKGYLDTGNFLIDNITKKPILIINLKTFFKMFKDINIVDVINLNLDKKISGKYINCKTVTGYDKMFVFNAQGIYIEQNKNFKKLDVLLGFNFKFNLKNNNFDILLSPICVTN